MAEAIQDVKQAQAEKGSATAISAPAPTVMARKSKVEAEAAPGQSLASVGGTPQESATQDARALYYGNQLAVGVNAFVAPSGGVGGAPPAPTEARADVATRSATAISRLAAPAAAGAVRLGLRVSIVRGSGEADLTTVLDPGETVRLKVIPNADGFLYVVGGTRMFASATAQRLKAFETPELSFDGSGQKHLYIVLSHRPETLASLSPGTLARDNVVESSSSQEGATYAVAGPRDTAAVTVVVPVTLTYR
jgi:hypothetical protein